MRRLNWGTSKFKTFLTAKKTTSARKRAVLLFSSTCRRYLRSLDWLWGSIQVEMWHRLPSCLVRLTVWWNQLHSFLYVVSLRNESSTLLSSSASAKNCQHAGLHKRATNWVFVVSLSFLFLFTCFSVSVYNIYRILRVSPFRQRSTVMETDEGLQHPQCIRWRI